MPKTSLNSTGFGLIGALVIVVVLAAIASSGFYVYHEDHKTKTSASTNSTSSKSTSSTSGTTSTTADPYVGWKTATLQYEKVSFKYPPSWQVSNTSKDETATGGTVTPGADTAILTSPNGLLVSLESGVAGVGDTDGIDTVLPGAQRINTLGGSYYLDSYAHDPDNPTVAQGACVDKSASVPGIPYLASKNIQLTNAVGQSNGPAADLFCIKYKNVVAEQQDLTLEHDASYNDAKLIIESLAY